MQYNTFVHLQYIQKLEVLEFGWPKLIFGLHIRALHTFKPKNRYPITHIEHLDIFLLEYFINHFFFKCF